MVAGLDGWRRAVPRGREAIPGDGRKWVGRLAVKGQVHRCSIDNEQRCNSFNGAL